MNEPDLLILTVYIISVVYVLYQAINTLDDQTAFQFERRALDQLLEEQELNGLIDLSFKFEDRYKFEEQPKKLSLSLENKSTDKSFKVEWDQSSLTDHVGRSHRVIRLTPDKRFNLPGYLAFSIVPPGKTLKEDFTPENVLDMNVDGSLETTKPIIDLAGIEKAGKKSDKMKQLYADFMERRVNIPFQCN